MILAELWVIVKPNNKGVLEESFASTAHDAWERALIVYWQHLKEDLFKKGHRARRVQIVFK